MTRLAFLFPGGALKRVELLAHSIRHTRAAQLRDRLWHSIKRRFSKLLWVFRLANRDWYLTDPPPRLRPHAVTGPVLGDGGCGQALPVTTNLAGTHLLLDVGFDWNRPTIGRGTQLEKMALHYMESLHGLRCDDAARLMRDWIAHVPPYQPGYWKDSWNSYVLSMRALAWMDRLTACDGSCLTEDVRTIEQSLAAQIRFLAGNLETDLGGNHLLKNLRALLRAGTYFTGRKRPRGSTEVYGSYHGSYASRFFPMACISSRVLRTTFR